MSDQLRIVCKDGKPENVEIFLNGVNILETHNIDKAVITLSAYSIPKVELSFLYVAVDVTGETEDMP